MLGIFPSGAKRHFFSPFFSHVAPLFPFKKIKNTEKSPRFCLRQKMPNTRLRVSAMNFRRKKYGENQGLICTNSMIYVISMPEFFRTAGLPSCQNFAA
jgi:hypothetical protein